MKIEAKKLLRVPATALLLGAALGMSVPAISLAGPPATASVQVSDLNLSTVSGQRKLERRTARAIEEVCPVSGSATSARATSSAAHRECAQSVRSSVKEQLDDRGARAVAGRS